MKMTIKKEIEFNNIISDILKNEEFIDLKYEIHHGMSRLDHSLNVAKLSFDFCKLFHLDNVSEVTRAALLHDFFKTKDVPGICFINHPSIAVINAKRNFEISKLQENIIASHMFPVSRVIPRYKESWLVSFSDKCISFKECFRYKIPLEVGAAFLFFLNFSIIQK